MQSSEFKPKSKRRNTHTYRPLYTGPFPTGGCTQHGTNDDRYARRPRQTAGVVTNGCEISFRSNTAKSLLAQNLQSLHTSLGTAENGASEQSMQWSLKS